MASKETLKMRAAQAGEELRQTGHLVVHAPVLVRIAECMIRFLMGWLLAGAEIFNGYTPFGLGLVAVSGSGLGGFCALIGTCLGYMTFQEFVPALRYVAAAILIYAISFAFFDIRLYQQTWFMPAAAGTMDGITGLVALSDQGWTAGNVICFGTEILLCSASAYFYRIAFSPWSQCRESERLTGRQSVSLLILMGTLLITLEHITLAGDLSVGRIIAVSAVMAASFCGGSGAGATMGVACGVGMDLADGGLPVYAMAYSFSGAVAGVFSRQGRLSCVLAYVMTNALTVFWGWETNLKISLLYEVFVASILFFLFPKKTLRRLEGVLRGSQDLEARHRNRTYTQERMETAAEAFRSLAESLRSAFASPVPNDGDGAVIFDRAAGRVCRQCALRHGCWQRDYVSTFNALNDALPTLMERGKGEAGDFPDYFSARCIRFSDFLNAVNEEVAALLCRKQYNARLRENRAAVCGEYGTLAEVLTDAASELGGELMPDPAQLKRLHCHLAARGLEPEAAVYYDEMGHLRVELEGAGLTQLRSEEGVEKLSETLGVPLRLAEGQRPGMMVLVEKEPLNVLTGLASRHKDGQTVSGDNGRWFRREDGCLFLLLCDGMGTGPEACRESRMAVHLLEQFLRAGVRTQLALKTLSSALALRGEETGGFTTIDLLQIDLFTGETILCKYGAAPSYIKRDSAVSRLTGTSLPAGIAIGEGTDPDVTRLKLTEGDCVLLVSDGVAGTESDQWLMDRFAADRCTDPGKSAEAILAEGKQRTGDSDDRTALLMRIIRNK